MRNYYLKKFAVVFSAVFMIGIQMAWSQTWKAGQNVNATLKDGTLTISGTGRMWDFCECSEDVVPWLSYMESITKVVIKDHVLSIGDDAFAGCVNLTSVSIPNSVVSIGGDAFVGCRRLTSVNIPNSVTKIGMGAFEGCMRLTLISIPNGVSEVEKRTFASCTSLTSVTIPNSVTKIGDNAFEDCTKQMSITIPNSVTKIGCDVFLNCNGLKSITSLNAIPPGMGCYSIGGIIETACLYVPASNIEVYKSDKKWKTFECIKEAN